MGLCREFEMRLFPALKTLQNRAHSRQVRQAMQIQNNARECSLPPCRPERLQSGQGALSSFTLIALFWPELTLISCSLR